MTFEDLQLIRPLLRAVEEKGYTIPTPIQAHAIPPALAGRDLLGCAQTGTGKTAAFILPILQLLDARPRIKGRRAIQALVLTPTRELAIQIDECCRDYARYTDLRHTVIFGGVNQRPQVDTLQQGVDLLIATPGRLLDLIGQGYISLDEVRHFVLDEADRMLDMGFIHDIRRILPMLPRNKQTLFFSATMPSSIASLAASLLHDPAEVTVTPPASVVDTIGQQICFVEKAGKSKRLIALLEGSDAEAVLVFSRTKHGADRIARVLNKAGIVCSAIHGDKSQGAREKAMNGFKSGKCRVLVATDIAARGIDISELPLVINYDLPEVSETYVHRIGRTGRAGCEGQAYSFCAEEEIPLLRDIEKIIGRSIPVDASVETPEWVPQPAPERPNARKSPAPRTARPAAAPRQQPAARQRNSRGSADRKDTDRRDTDRRDPAAPRQQERPAAQKRTSSAPKQRSQAAPRPNGPADPERRRTAAPERRPAAAQERNKSAVSAQAPAPAAQELARHWWQRRKS